MKNGASEERISQYDMLKLNRIVRKGNLVPWQRRHRRTKDKRTLKIRI